MPFNPSDDRRSEPRRPTNARGVVVAPGLELPCAIVDVSANGMRIRLERNIAVPREIVVVDVATGLAHEVQVQWRDGHEAGLKRLSSRSVRGLAPGRLAPARDAWLRAGGR